MNNVVRERCDWAGSDPLYIAYHDSEWGRALHDDRALFEMLTLEGFQAGLAWITILRKREHFRAAFDAFDWKKVARYGAAERRRLLADSGIVRNRLKVDATISNAAAFERVRAEFGSFDKYIWAFTGGGPLPVRKRANTSRQLPTHSKESGSMSADLRARGFRFVGTTICYAFMQAIGMVDDHQAHCWCARKPVRARSRSSR